MQNGKASSERPPYRSSEGRGRKSSYQSNKRNPPRNSRPSLQPVPKFNELSRGTAVSIVMKADQPTGREVQGSVSELLSYGNHPRGVKVRLSDGRVGRVQRLIVKEGEVEDASTRSGSSTNRIYTAAESSSYAKSSTAGQDLLAPQSRNRYHDFRNDGYSYDDRPAHQDELNLLDYVKVAPPKGRRGRKSKGLDETLTISQALEESEHQPESQQDNNELDLGSHQGRPQAFSYHHRNEESTMKGQVCDAESLGETEAPGMRLRAAEPGTANLRSAKSTCPVCHEFEGDEVAVSHHVASHFG